MRWNWRPGLKSSIHWSRMSWSPAASMVSVCDVFSGVDFLFAAVDTDIHLCISKCRGHLNSGDKQIGISGFIHIEFIADFSAIFQDNGAKRLAQQGNDFGVFRGRRAVRSVSGNTRFRIDLNEIFFVVAVFADFFFAQLVGKGGGGKGREFLQRRRQQLLPFAMRRLVVLLYELVERAPCLDASCGCPKSFAVVVERLLPCNVTRFLCLEVLRSYGCSCLNGVSGRTSRPIFSTSCDKMLYSSRKRSNSLPKANALKWLLSISSGLHTAVSS